MLKVALGTRSDNHSDQSATQSSILILDLYEEMPSSIPCLEHTHTHTHTLSLTHTLSHACTHTNTLSLLHTHTHTHTGMNMPSLSVAFSCFSEPAKQNNSWYVWQTADFPLVYANLNGKISTITSKCKCCWSTAFWDRTCNTHTCSEECHIKESSIKVVYIYILVRKTISLSKSPVPFASRIHPASQFDPSLKQKAGCMQWLNQGLRQALNATAEWHWQKDGD